MASETQAKDLLYAASRGYEDVFNTISDLSKYVNIVDELGNTPLHLSAAGNHPPLVSILIKANANINAQNNLGETPLHRASIRSNEECVTLLLDAGADYEILNQNQKTPLDVARQEEIMELFPNWKIKGHAIEDDGEDGIFLEFEEDDEDEGRDL